MEKNQSGYGMNAAKEKAARDCAPAALGTAHNGFNHSPIDRLLNRIERVLVLLLNASTRSGLALLSVGGVLLIGRAK